MLGERFVMIGGYERDGHGAEIVAEIRDPSLIIPYRMIARICTVFVSVSDNGEIYKQTTF